MSLRQKKIRLRRKMRKWWLALSIKEKKAYILSLSKKPRTSWSRRDRYVFGRHAQEGNIWDEKHRKAQAERCKETLEDSWEDPERRKKTLKALHKGLRRRWKRPGARKEQSEIFKKQLADWIKSGIVSKRMEKLWQDPKFRRKMAKISRFQARQNFTRRSRSVNTKKQWKDPVKREVLLKSLTEAQNRLWENPKHRKKMHDALHNSQERPSRPQKFLHQRLCRIGIKGFELEYVVGRYSLDVANPLLKLCIEVDGPQWHDRKSDRKRDCQLKKLGWRILRIKLKKNKVTDSQWLRVLRFISSNGKKRS